MSVYLVCEPGLSNFKCNQCIAMLIVFPNLEDDDDDSILSLSRTAVFIINHVKSEVVSDSGV